MKYRGPNVDFDGQLHPDSEFDNGNSGAGTVTIDWNKGNRQKLTLTGDCLINSSNAKVGAFYSLRLVNDATPRTPTWQSAFIFPGANAPRVLPASGFTLLGLYCYDGTNMITSPTRDMNMVELPADVSSSASTSFQDITGFSFSVVAGQAYRFYALLLFDASANTIGMRASLTGPASPTRLAYHTRTVPGATTGGAVGANNAQFTNGQNSYDVGTTSTAAVGTTGNLCIIEGIIIPSADGSVQFRFAPETNTSGGTVIKAGSSLQWW